MKTKSICWLICGILGFQFWSCSVSDNGYIDNPSNMLDFSTNLVSFDTVFTSVGSAADKFVVYNRNDEPMFIDDIILSGSDESGFRMSVNNKKGDHFRDVTVPANDSLLVKVDVTINPNKYNQGLLVKDSILFSFNGRSEAVVLEACGQDVNLMKSKLITKDCYLSADKPYFVYDSIVIAPGAKLTIQEGAIFYMHERANLINYGTIIAKGTLTRPIVFRGDKAGLFISDVSPYDKMPERWGGVFMQSCSFDNVMEYVVVRDAYSGITMEKSDPSRNKLSIKNSQITNSFENVLSCFDCKLEACNTEFSNAGGCVVLLLGGNYKFTHCTIANFLPINDRTVEALTMANNANKKLYPISATFDNCVIDGNFPVSTLAYNGELNLSMAMGAKFDYRFNHCLIKSEKRQEAAYQNVLFTSTSQVYRLDGGERCMYRYDFRPDSSAEIAVGMADADVSAKYPTDRNGVSRASSKQPTIGAYEYVPM